MKRVLSFILVFIMLMSVNPVFAYEETVEIEDAAVNNSPEKSFDVENTDGEKSEEETEESAELLLIGSKEWSLYIGDYFWLDVYNWTLGVDIPSWSISWTSNAPSEVKVCQTSYDKRSCQIQAVGYTGSSPAIVTFTYKTLTSSGYYKTNYIDFRIYTDYYVPVTGISFNTQEIAIKAGKTGTVTATIYPGNASNKGIDWSTSNSNIVTVSNGTITAKNVGKAIITATARGYNYSSDTVNVRVYNVGEKGDVNGDSRYNVADGLMAIRMGLPATHPNRVDAVDEEKAAADVNGDGVCNVADALLMIRRGLPASHPNHLAKFPTE